jgi:hypothetical protein
MKIKLKDLEFAPLSEQTFKTNYYKEALIFIRVCTYMARNY